MNIKMSIAALWARKIVCVVLALALPLSDPFLARAVAAAASATSSTQGQSTSNEKAPEGATPEKQKYKAPIKMSSKILPSKTAKWKSFLKTLYTYNKGLLVSAYDAIGNTNSNYSLGRQTDQIAAANGYATVRYQYDKNGYVLYVLNAANNTRTSYDKNNSKLSSGKAQYDEMLVGDQWTRTAKYNYDPATGRLLSKQTYGFVGDGNAGSDEVSVNLDNTKTPDYAVVSETFYDAYGDETEVKSYWTQAYRVSKEAAEEDSSVTENAVTYNAAIAQKDENGDPQQFWVKGEGRVTQKFLYNRTGSAKQLIAVVNYREDGGHHQSNLTFYQANKKDKFSINLAKDVTVKIIDEKIYFNDAGYSQIEFIEKYKDGNTLVKDKNGKTLAVIQSESIYESGKKISVNSYNADTTKPDAPGYGKISETTYLDNYGRIEHTLTYAYNSNGSQLPLKQGDYIKYNDTGEPLTVSYKYQVLKNGEYVVEEEQVTYKAGAKMYEINFNDIENGTAQIKFNDENGNQAKTYIGALNITAEKDISEINAYDITAGGGDRYIGLLSAYNYVRGMLKSVFDAVSNKMTAFVAGMQDREVSAKGYTTTEYKYDAKGNLLYVFNPITNTRTNYWDGVSLDDNKNPLSSGKAQYDEIKTAGDKWTVTAKYVYDGNGKIVEKLNYGYVGMVGGKYVNINSGETGITQNYAVVSKTAYDDSGREKYTLSYWTQAYRVSAAGVIAAKNAVPPEILSENAITYNAAYAKKDEKTGQPRLYWIEGNGIKSQEYLYDSGSSNKQLVAVVNYRDGKQSSLTIYDQGKYDKRTVNLMKGVTAKIVNGQLVYEKNNAEIQNARIDPVRHRVVGTVNGTEVVAALVQNENDYSSPVDNTDKNAVNGYDYDTEQINDDFDSKDKFISEYVKGKYGLIDDILSENGIDLTDAASIKASVTTMRLISAFNALIRISNMADLLHSNRGAAQAASGVADTDKKKANKKMLYDIFSKTLAQSLRTGMNKLKVYSYNADISRPNNFESGKLTEVTYLDDYGRVTHTETYSYDGSGNPVGIQPKPGSYIKYNENLGPDSSIRFSYQYVYGGVTQTNTEVVGYKPGGKMYEINCADIENGLVQVKYYDRNGFEKGTYVGKIGQTGINKPVDKLDISDIEIGTEQDYSGLQSLYTYGRGMVQSVRDYVSNKVTNLVAGKQSEQMAVGFNYQTLEYQYDVNGSMLFAYSPATNTRTSYWDGVSVDDKGFPVSSGIMQHDEVFTNGVWEKVSNYTYDANGMLLTKQNLGYVGKNLAGNPIIDVVSETFFDSYGNEQKTVSYWVQNGGNGTWIKGEGIISQKYLYDRTGAGKKLVAVVDYKDGKQSSVNIYENGKYDKWTVNLKEGINTSIIDGKLTFSDGTVFNGVTKNSDGSIAAIGNAALVQSENVYNGLKKVQVNSYNADITRYDLPTSGKLSEVAYLDDFGRVNHTENYLYKVTTNANGKKIIDGAPIVQQGSYMRYNDSNELQQVSYPYPKTSGNAGTTVTYKFGAKMYELNYADKENGIVQVKYFNGNGMEDVTYTGKIKSGSTGKTVEKLGISDLDVDKEYTGLQSVYSYTKGVAESVMDYASNKISNLFANKQDVQKTTTFGTSDYNTLEYKYDSNGSVLYVYNKATNMRTSYKGADGMSVGKAKFDEIYTQVGMGTGKKPIYDWVKTGEYVYNSYGRLTSRLNYGYVGNSQPDVVSETFYDDFGDETNTVSYWVQAYKVASAFATTQLLSGSITFDKTKAQKDSNGDPLLFWTKRPGGVKTQESFYDRTGPGKKLLAVVNFNGVNDDVTHTPKQTSVTLYENGRYEKYTVNLNKGVNYNPSSYSTLLASCKGSSKIISGVGIVQSQNIYTGLRKTSTKTYNADVTQLDIPATGKPSEEILYDNYGRVSYTVTYSYDGNGIPQPTYGSYVKYNDTFGDNYEFKYEYSKTVFDANGEADTVIAEPFPVKYKAGAKMYEINCSDIDKNLVQIKFYNENGMEKGIYIGGIEDKNVTDLIENKDLDNVTMTGYSYTGIQSLYDYYKGMLKSVTDYVSNKITNFVAGKQDVQVMKDLDYNTVEYKYDAYGAMLYVYNPATNTRTTYDKNGDGISEGKAQYDEMFFNGEWVRTAGYVYDTSNPDRLTSKQNYGYVGSAATGNDVVSVNMNGSSTPGYAVTNETFYDAYGSETETKSYWVQNGNNLTWVKGNGIKTQEYLYDRTGAGKKLVAVVGYRDSKQSSVTVYENGKYDKWTLNLMEGITVSVSAGKLKFSDGTVFSSVPDSNKILGTGNKVIALTQSENVYEGLKKVKVISCNSDITRSALPNVGLKNEVSYLDIYGRATYTETFAYDKEGNQIGNAKPGTSVKYNDTKNNISISYPNGTISYKPGAKMYEMNYADIDDGIVQVRYNNENGMDAGIYYGSVTAGTDIVYKSLTPANITVTVAENGPYHGMQTVYNYVKGVAVSMNDLVTNKITNLVAGKQDVQRTTTFNTDLVTISGTAVDNTATSDYTTLQYQYDSNGSVLYVLNPANNTRTSYAGADGKSTGKAQYDQIKDNGVWINTAKYNYDPATTGRLVSKSNYGYVGSAGTAADYVDIDGIAGKEAGYAVVSETIFDDYGDEEGIKTYWRHNDLTSFEEIIAEPQQAVAKAEKELKEAEQDVLKKTELKTAAEQAKNEAQKAVGAAKVEYEAAQTVTATALHVLRVAEKELKTRKDNLKWTIWGFSRYKAKYYVDKAQAAVNVASGKYNEAAAAEALKKASYDAKKSDFESKKQVFDNAVNGSNGLVKAEENKTNKAGALTTKRGELQEAISNQADASKQYVKGDGVISQKYIYDRSGAGKKLVAVINGTDLGGSNEKQTSVTIYENGKYDKWTIALKEGVTVSQTAADGKKLVLTDKDGYSKVFDKSALQDNQLRVGGRGVCETGASLLGVLQTENIYSGMKKVRVNNYNADVTKWQKDNPESGKLSEEVFLDEYGRASFTKSYSYNANGDKISEKISSSIKYNDTGDDSSSTNYNYYKVSIDGNGNSAVTMGQQTPAIVYPAGAKMYEMDFSEQEYGVVNIKYFNENGMEKASYLAPISPQADPLNTGIPNVTANNSGLTSAGILGSYTGLQSVYEYSKGMLTSVRDWMSNKITYFVAGKQDVQKTDIFANDGDTTTSDYETLQYKYDAKGNVIYLYNPATKTRTSYDKDGDKISDGKAYFDEIYAQAGVDSNGTPVFKWTKIAGYNYNANGRLVSKSNYGYVGSVGTAADYVDVDGIAGKEAGYAVVSDTIFDVNGNEEKTVSYWTQEMRKADGTSTTNPQEAVRDDEYGPPTRFWVKGQGITTQVYFYDRTGQGKKLVCTVNYKDGKESSVTTYENGKYEKYSIALNQGVKVTTSADGKKIVLGKDGFNQEFNINSLDSKKRLGQAEVPCVSPDYRLGILQSEYFYSGTKKVKVNTYNADVTKWNNNETGNLNEVVYLDNFGRTTYTESYTYNEYGNLKQTISGNYTKYNDTGGNLTINYKYVKTDIKNDANGIPVPVYSVVSVPVIYKAGAKMYDMDFSDLGNDRVQVKYYNENGMMKGVYTGEYTTDGITYDAFKTLNLNNTNDNPCDTDTSSIKTYTDIYSAPKAIAGTGAQSAYNYSMGIMTSVTDYVSNKVINYIANKQGTQKTNVFDADTDASTSDYVTLHYQYDVNGSVLYIYDPATGQRTSYDRDGDGISEGKAFWEEVWAECKDEKDTEHYGTYNWTKKVRYVYYNSDLLEPPSLLGNQTERLYCKQEIDYLGFASSDEEGKEKMVHVTGSEFINVYTGAAQTGVPTDYGVVRTTKYDKWGQEVETVSHWQQVYKSISVTYTSGTGPKSIADNSGRIVSTARSSFGDIFEDMSKDFIVRECYTTDISKAGMYDSEGKYKMTYKQAEDNLESFDKTYRKKEQELTDLISVRDALPKPDPGWDFNYTGSAYQREMQARQDAIDAVNGRIAAKTAERDAAKIELEDERRKQAGWSTKSGWTNKKLNSSGDLIDEKNENKFQEFWYDSSGQNKKLVAAVGYENGKQSSVTMYKNGRYDLGAIKLEDNITATHDGVTIKIGGVEVKESDFTPVDPNNATQIKSGNTLLGMVQSATKYIGLRKLSVTSYLDSKSTLSKGGINSVTYYDRLGRVERVITYNRDVNGNLKPVNGTYEYSTRITRYNDAQYVEGNSYRQEIFAYNNLLVVGLDTVKYINGEDESTNPPPPPSNITYGHYFVNIFGYKLWLGTREELGTLQLRSDDELKTLITAEGDTYYDHKDKINYGSCPEAYVFKLDQQKVADKINSFVVGGEQKIEVYGVPGNTIVSTNYNGKTPDPHSKEGNNLPNWKEYLSKYLGMKYNAGAGIDPITADDIYTSKVVKNDKYNPCGTNLGLKNDYELSELYYEDTDPKTGAARRSSYLDIKEGRVLINNPSSSFFSRIGRPYVPLELTPEKFPNAYNYGPSGGEQFIKQSITSEQGSEDVLDIQSRKFLKDAQIKMKVTDVVRYKAGAKMYEMDDSGGRTVSVKYFDENGAQKAVYKAYDEGNKRIDDPTMKPSSLIREKKTDPNAEGAISSQFVPEIEERQGPPPSFHFSVPSVYSDLRLKEDVSPIENVLGKVMRLKPVWFRYNNGLNDRLNIGFIAQDVELLFPTIVSEIPQKSGEKYKALAYHEFGVLAIEAVKELKSEKDAEIMKLKTENELLKTKNNELEQKYKEFELRLEKLEKK